MERFLEFEIGYQVTITPLALFPDIRNRPSGLDKVLRNPITISIPGRVVPTAPGQLPWLARADLALCETCRTRREVVLDFLASHGPTTGVSHTGVTTELWIDHDFVMWDMGEEDGPSGAARSILDRVTAAWAKERLLYVWDRGFSAASWLGEALDRGLTFVARWKKRNKLRPADAPSVGDSKASANRQEGEGIAAWKLTRMKNWGTRNFCRLRSALASLWNKHTPNYQAPPRMLGVCLFGRWASPGCRTSA